MTTSDVMRTVEAKFEMRSVGTRCLNLNQQLITGEESGFLSSLHPTQSQVSLWKASNDYCNWVIHSRTIFSNFSLFGATIYQLYEVKSATIFRGRLCFKGDYVLRKYGTYIPIENTNNFSQTV